MGKIKTKLIRKTSSELIESDVEFGEDFEKNKKMIGKVLPSKKLRNQVAGLISRTKKKERIEKELNA